MSVLHRRHIPVVTHLEFDQLVLAGSRERLTAVEFYSPGCPDSRTQGSAIDAAVAATRGRVQWFNVNVELERTLTANLDVTHTPAVFVFQDGRVVRGHIGSPLSAGELLDLVSAARQQGSK